MVCRWSRSTLFKALGSETSTKIPIYPTQAFESFGAFSIFALLSWLWVKHRRFDGQIFACLLLLYPILRGTIEAFRGDVVRGTDWLVCSRPAKWSAFPPLPWGSPYLPIRMRHEVEPETPWVYEE